MTLSAPTNHKPLSKNVSLAIGYGDPQIPSIQQCKSYPKELFPYVWMEGDEGRV